MHNTTLQEFKAQITFRMTENTRIIQKCLSEVDEEAFWIRPNRASNSLGVQLLHLCGNIRQYGIAALGNGIFDRQRDAEFTAQGEISKAEALEKLENTVTEALTILQEAGETEMMRVRRVQGFDLSGIGIALHICEHYSYHTGQIAFWVKLLINRDLGLYDHLDLNEA
jgi:uncharacterized damage-inducible protein DinB